MKSGISKAEAELELALMQAESDAMTSSDLYIWLRECGLPSEVAIRVRDLADVTRRIGCKVVSIGKLIVMKLHDFIVAHKGLAIGSLLGAAVASLIASLPLLGSLLAPLGTLLGLTFVVTGHQQDKHGAGGAMKLLELPQSLIEIAQAYFEVFIETLRAVMVELTPVKSS